MVQEMQMMKLLVQHADSRGQFRYKPLRVAQVPEEIARIFDADAEFLDALVSRKLQILRDKGWIQMDDGLYTILHFPTGN